MLTHVFPTHICFPECIQHTWFAHTYIHVFLPTDTKYFSPFHTHAHALSHKHFSSRRVFPAQPARLRPRSNRHTVSHSFAQIHDHSLTYFHIRGSLLIPPRVQIHTQSPSFPALVQSASICNHVHQGCLRKMPRSGTQ